MQLAPQLNAREVPGATVCVRVCVPPQGQCGRRGRTFFLDKSTGVYVYSNVLLILFTGQVNFAVAHKGP